MHTMMCLIYLDIRVSNTAVITSLLQIVLWHTSYYCKHQQLTELHALTWSPLIPGVRNYSAWFFLIGPGEKWFFLILLDSAQFQKALVRNNSAWLNQAESFLTEAFCKESSRIISHRGRVLGVMIFPHDYESSWPLILNRPYMYYTWLPVISGIYLSVPSHP